MADSVKKWLKHQLDSVIHVQRTATGSEADLVVSTWSGIKILIFLVDQPVKLRAIKNTLNSASSAGINTLFLVDSGLLPPEGKRTLPDEWLLAIHALTGERIYTYRADGSSPALYQIHFNRVSSTDEYETWYGPEVSLKRIRSFRFTVKRRSIKGDWLVADFDSPNFWNDNGYRNYQASRQKRARRHNTTWRTWSDYQKSWQGADETVPTTHGMIQQYLDECYALLDVSQDASQEEVKAAFRRQALMVHPDTSKLPAEEAELKFRALSAAYEYIKTVRQWG
jgi:hypothetical protein